MSKIPPKGTPERSQWYADLQKKRTHWPERKEPASKRRPPRAFPAGSDVELAWEATAKAAGYTPDGMSRIAWRRLVFRLATVEVGRIVEESRSSVKSPLSDTDALALTFDELESIRLRQRTERDRQIAAQHDREADEAEERLVARMRRLGLA